MTRPSQIISATSLEAAKFLWINPRPSATQRSTVLQRTLVLSLRSAKQTGGGGRGGVSSPAGCKASSCRTLLLAYKKIGGLAQRSGCNTRGSAEMELQRAARAANPQQRHPENDLLTFHSNHLSRLGFGIRGDKQNIQVCSCRGCIQTAQHAHLPRAVTHGFQPRRKLLLLSPAQYVHHSTFQLPKGGDSSGMQRQCIDGTEKSNR